MNVCTRTYGKSTKHIASGHGCSWCLKLITLPCCCGVETYSVKCCTVEIKTQRERDSRQAATAPSFYIQLICLKIQNSCQHDSLSCFSHTECCIIILKLKSKLSLLFPPVAQKRSAGVIYFNSWSQCPAFIHHFMCQFHTLFSVWRKRLGRGNTCK